MTALNQAAVDFFRCSDALFDFTLTGELSAGPSYFSFGPGTTCYGRCAAGPCATVSAGKRADLMAAVAISGSTLRLPFDPTEIVENLRRERYAVEGCPGKGNILPNPVVQRLYYALRPFLGIPIRKHFQRLYVEDRHDLAFPRWPVDTTVERILERLLCLSMKANNLTQVPFIWFWPGGATNCITITHDIETQNGVRSAPQLMSLDDTFGIKASFQVIPEGPYHAGPDLLDSIRRRGFEVNVHDLDHRGNLFRDREQFFRKAHKINGYVREYESLGFRSGSMYRNVDWYDAFDIAYDLSVPNVGHFEAQRGGCCTVFPYFIGDILELPLTTVQDYSLFHILGDYSIDVWKRQVALIREAHGLASFIVHPDYVREKRAAEGYAALLKHLTSLRDENGAWIALPREVDRWWRARSKMALVVEDGRWRIKGESSEQARVGYATVNEDLVVYSVAEQMEPSAEVGAGALSIARVP